MNKTARMDILVYEAEGLRKDGSVFGAVVIERQTDGAAIELAQSYADKWDKSVMLYRVPFVHTGHEQWREDQEVFVRGLRPKSAGGGEKQTSPLGKQLPPFHNDAPAIRER